MEEEEAVVAAEPGVEVDLEIEEVLVDISQERDADPGKYIISGAISLSPILHTILQVQLCICNVGSHIYKSYAYDPNALLVYP